MSFPHPDNMAQLAQSVRALILDLKKTSNSIDAGAGINAVELIRLSYEYTGNPELADTRAIEALAEMQELARLLRDCVARATTFKAHVQRAVLAMNEYDAKFATKVAEGSKFRI